eukprot:533660_1
MCASCPEFADFLHFWRHKVRGTLEEYRHTRQPDRHSRVSEGVGGAGRSAEPGRTLSVQPKRLPVKQYYCDFRSDSIWEEFIRLSMVVVELLFRSSMEFPCCLRVWSDFNLPTTRVLYTSKIFGIVWWSI